MNPKAYFLAALVTALCLLFAIGNTIAAPLMPVLGGTGTSTKPTFGQILVGNSSGTYTLAATSSLGITGGGSTGTVSTSTNETSGFLPYWTTTSATPARLGQVATGTLSATSPLFVSATRSLVGGAAGLSWDFSVANTWTGLQTLTAASTTRLSCLGNCAFGLTATSSFSTAGALTLATPLAVTSGGTGLSSLGGTNRILFTTSVDNIASNGDFTFNTGSGELTLPDMGEITPLNNNNGSLGLSSRFWANLYVTNASTTNASFSYASSTVWRGGGLNTDCDTAASSKLLWDATTGQFSCGTDQTGGGASFGQAWEIGGNGFTGFLAPTTTQKIWIGQASSTVLSAHSAEFGVFSATTTATSTIAGGLQLTGNPRFLEFAPLTTNPTPRSGIQFSETTAGTSQFSVLYDGAGSGGNNKLVFHDPTTATDLFTFLRGGQLGIGTTSPYAALSVVGATGVVAEKFHATSTTATSVFSGILQVLTRFFTVIAAAFTPTTEGEIGIDTTSNQLKYYSGGSVRVLQPIYYSSFSYSTTTTWTGTTTIPLGPAGRAETWVDVKCFTDTSFVSPSFNDGTNRMNYFVASTTVGTITISTNASFTASEKRYVDIGTTTTATTKQVSCTIGKTYDAD